MEGKKLFLLDAYGLIYRAYYALIRAPRFTTKGMNTSAVFGFCNTLDEVLRSENPEYIAVCFDPPGGSTFRSEAYPEYKAQRQKQPEDITIAIPYIKRILEAYRIPVVEVPGFEADDVIGTLALQASAKGFDTYMMTMDKDYGQLVRDNVSMYRPALKGKGFEVRGPQQVCDLYGIQRPEQVIDLLALEGDSSDNVPGCPGIGEKTAVKLISEWGTVENLIEHAAEIKGANQKKIQDNKEQILFSKFLVTIRTDVPMPVTLDSLKRVEPDVDKLIEIYDELEFKSFVNKLRARTVLDAPAPPEVAAPGGGMGSLFDFDSAAEAAPAPAKVDFALADTPEAVAVAAKKAIEAGTVGLALAAVGDEPMTARLTGVALSWADDQNVFIPIDADSQFKKQETLTMLAPLLDSPAVTIVCHDVKRAMVILKREMIDFQSAYYDTSVAHYLLKPEAKHNLDFAAFDVLGYRTLTYSLSDLDRRKLAKEPEAPERVAERARVELMLLPALKKLIEEQEQTALMTDIELPFVAVLASMEWEGARIDVATLAEMSASLTTRLHTLEQDCYTLAGEQFNIGSPSQVGEILFGKMQIDPKAKRTKTGAWSTTEEILEKHRRQYPLVDKILQVRALRKLLATYIDALPKLINPLTGKIHTSYNQTVTATGRISSNNPNLQNIPIRTPDGRLIRKAFIPDKGCLMMSADYSQIELRLIADFSGDEHMVAAFNSGQDIHRATAAKIYHLPIEEVTDNQRRNAKTANFGIIYGISPFGLSERLEIPRSEAKMLIDGYLASYPGVKEYMDASIEKARQSGYVTTIMGRKRYLPDINSRNATVRGYAERNAINAPLQGSAADIIKIAMIRIHRHIIEAGLKSRMIMQVHDELIFNIEPSELAQMQKIVIEDMEGAYSGKVRLEVSAGVGANWLEAH